MTQDGTFVLHFDINKTLYMRDTAGGKSTEDIVSEIIASSVYGEVDSHMKWVAVSVGPTPIPPDSKNLIDFKAYIDDVLFPYPKMEDGVTKEQQREKNQFVKDKRKVGLSTFTDAGKPGEQYRSYYHSLLSALAKPGIAGGYRVIVNSFFRLLVHLDNIKADFRIVFRTFGTDLEEIGEAMNEFCDGKHPDFPGIYMPQLRLNLPNDAGAFFRDGERQILVIGTLEKPKSMSVGAAFYESLNLPIIDNYKAMYTCIMDRLSTRYVAAYTDYYDWWAANNEASHAGKLLIVDPETLYPRHILFDDNINTHSMSEDRNIVDVRNIDGQHILIKDALRFIVQVDSLEAIRDSEYFIKELENALNR
eukprot:CFRG6342T1